MPAEKTIRRLQSVPTPAVDLQAALADRCTQLEREAAKAERRAFAASGEYAKWEHVLAPLVAALGTVGAGGAGGLASIAHLPAVTIAVVGLVATAVAAAFSKLQLRARARQRWTQYARYQAIADKAGDLRILLPTLSTATAVKRLTALRADLYKAHMTPLRDSARSRKRPAKAATATAEPVAPAAAAVPLRAA
jgi:hypothetical protein